MSKVLLNSIRVSLEETGIEVKVNTFEVDEKPKTYMWSDRRLPKDELKFIDGSRKESVTSIWCDTLCLSKDVDEMTNILKMEVYKRYSSLNKKFSRLSSGMSNEIKSPLYREYATKLLLDFKEIS